MKEQKKQRKKERKREKLKERKLQMKECISKKKHEEVYTTEWTILVNSVVYTYICIYRMKTGWTKERYYGRICKRKSIKE